MKFAEGAPMPAITGVGEALPKRVVTNPEIAAMIGATPRAFEKMMGRVGVETRHWVTPGERASSDLVAIAAMGAMNMAGILPQEIRSLMVGTSSPDHISVSAAAMVQEKLGLRDDIRIYDIGGNACVGFLQALKTSFADLTSQLGDGGPQVVAGVEVLSRMVPDNTLKGIFGDGGGAVVTEMVMPDEGAPRDMAFAFGADGRYAQDLLIPAGGSKLFTTKETQEADQHYLHMNGAVIKDQAIHRMAQMMRASLKESGLPIEAVTYLIPHQANMEIITGVAEELNFSMDKVAVAAIKRSGNTSAGTIPIALNESVRSGKVKRNDIVGFITFGAGLEYAAGIVPMVGLPKYT